MVTAVDTNVLLDVFLDDPSYRLSSFAALSKALERGRVVVMMLSGPRQVRHFGMSLNLRQR